MTPYEQLAPGTLIGGKYELHHLIGAGGMGAVYLATQIDLGRKVAVKLLHPQFCADPDVIERFHREAKHAASIGHDNICEVTDFGISKEGIPFLVMPVLKGRPLTEVLSNDAIDRERICDIMRQVLSALDAAHVAGVVHRDLKPDNIFIAQVGDRRDFVKLLDFGISKIMESRAIKELTRTGTVLGTPAYMAPEQARCDKNVDHRLDIYAAGVIMYEALTGKRPYEGKSYNEILLKIVTEPYRPPREINPGIPPELAAVVQKAMSPNPSNRFIGAREMGEAIEKAMAISRSRPAGIAGNPSGVGMRPAPVSDRKWLLPISVSGLLIAAVGIVVAVWLLKETPTPAYVAASPPIAGDTRDPSAQAVSPTALGPQRSLEGNNTAAPSAPQLPPLETQLVAPEGMDETAAIAPSGPALKRTPHRPLSSAPEAVPAPDPPVALPVPEPQPEPSPVQEKAPTSSPTGTYANMSQLKTALKQGKISRAEYSAHQAEIRKKRAAEYDRLKREYRAGTITRGEYERQVVQVKRKYEGD